MREDIFNRLEVLAISAGEQAQNEFEAWLASISQETKRKFLHDVITIAGMLGLSLEDLKVPFYVTDGRKIEALSHYAMAVWKLYELEADGIIQPISEEEMDSTYIKAKGLTKELEERLTSYEKRWPSS